MRGGGVGAGDDALELAESVPRVTLCTFFVFSVNTSGRVPLVALDRRPDGRYVRSRKHVLLLRIVQHTTLMYLFLLCTRIWTLLLTWRVNVYTPSPTSSNSSSCQSPTNLPRSRTTMAYEGRGHTLAPSRSIRKLDTAWNTEGIVVSHPTANFALHGKVSNMCVSHLRSWQTQTLHFTVTAFTVPWPFLSPLGVRSM